MNHVPPSAGDGAPQDQPGPALIERLLPADDQLQRQPVFDFAMAELGCQATVSEEQGLEPTILYFHTISSV